MPKPNRSRCLRYSTAFRTPPVRSLSLHHPLFLRHSPLSGRPLGPNYAPFDPSGVSPAASSSANRQTFANPSYLALPHGWHNTQIVQVDFHASGNRRRAPSSRSCDARACFSHRIEKDPPHDPPILRVRQKRPSLASVSGTCFFLDGVSANRGGSVLPESTPSVLLLTAFLPGIPKACRDQASRGQTQGTKPCTIAKAASLPRPKPAAADLDPEATRPVLQPRSRDLRSPDSAYPRRSCRRAR